MKILLVDDEEQILKGVSRLISCEEDDWEVETALSGSEALDLLSEEEFDVVVSDMRMPGMDGAELLSEIGRQYPSMLRIVLSGEADRESVLRAVNPMHQYLSKPCEPEELFEFIRRAPVFQETIKSAAVLDAIGRANCLPVFPEIVNDINRETESESGSPKTIAALIAKDPLLSARLLHLANSAIFSPRTPIVDLERAIMTVGIDMIRALAMSQAVSSDNQENDRILSTRGLLDHGLRVAVIGKKLSTVSGLSAEDSSTVFAACLLHDVGKLILLNAFPDEYSTVLEQAREKVENIDELEMASFGATHQGVAGYLFWLWGLPEELIQSVASHHSFQTCSDGEGLLSQLVFAANWIDNNRTEADLQAVVELAGETTEALEFAKRIAEWQQHITTSTNED